MAATALPAFPLDVVAGAGVTVKREGVRLIISIDAAAAVSAALLNLPTSPAGLGPGKLWRNGDALGGYVISQTGANS